jgi:diamine N-acetyltransferase
MLDMRKGEHGDVHLRVAGFDDVGQIAAMERLQEFRTFVGQWTEEEHCQKMANADVRYFVALSGQSEVTDARQSELAAFAILQGLTSEHRSIELKRVVVKSPGQGRGKQILRELLDRAFHEFKAHRVWLDVFETNLRARHVYESLGFRYDGIFREANFRDGAYHSLCLMSLLDREYAELEGR